jgi:quercetin dioxygenase-like cupin family protein
MHRTRAILTATLAAMLAAIGTTAATGQSPSASPLAPQITGLGAFTVGDIVGYPSGHTFSFSVPSGTTVQSAAVTLPPGFDFGWHHHTGAVIVEVTGGTLTLYDTSCKSQDVAAGQGFIEELGTVHRARNETSEPVMLVVTYVGVPAGQATDVAEQAPCEIPS